MRLRRPTVAQLERSDRQVVPELSTDDTDHSLAALIASDQVQRQPALNVGCPVVDVMVPSQGTNATGLRVFQMIIHLGVGYHLGRCRKTMQVR